MIIKITRESDKHTIGLQWCLDNYIEYYNSYRNVSARYAYQYALMKRSRISLHADLMQYFSLDID